ncbi:hypothetical protein [Kingella oralis]|uniref:hypothetical protein n=1 Tax=Kingella oralis TaxID=505 RepID=UPI0034E5C50C
MAYKINVPVLIGHQCPTYNHYAKPHFRLPCDAKTRAQILGQPEISVEQDNLLPPNAIAPFSGCLPSPIQQNKSSIC